MAQTVKLIMTDDIDGTESGDIKTIQFGIDNANYEIDLTPENDQKLREALDPFIVKARKRPATQGKTGRPRKSSGDNAGRADEIRKIREWAAENGIEVNQRGRIPKDVEDRYNEAMGQK